MSICHFENLSSKLQSQVARHIVDGIIFGGPLKRVLQSLLLLLSQFSSAQLFYFMPVRNIEKSHRP